MKKYRRRRRTGFNKIFDSKREGIESFVCIQSDRTTTKRFFFFPIWNCGACTILRRCRFAFLFPLFLNISLDKFLLLFSQIARTRKTYRNRCGLVCRNARPTNLQYTYRKQDRSITILNKFSRALQQQQQKKKHAITMIGYTEFHSELNI